MTNDDYPTGSKFGIFNTLINMEDQYERVSDTAKLVNDYNPLDEDDRRALNDMMITSFNGDTFDNIPTCMCGYTQKRVGVICTDCGTECLPMTERPIGKLLWVKAPEGVDKFITPQAWILFNEYLKVGSIEIVTYLTNPRYMAGSGLTYLPDVLEHFMSELKWKRSLNHFYRNFDLFIETMYQFSSTIKTSKSECVKFLDYMNKNKDKIFTAYLEIPDKILMIKEDTDLGSFVNTAIAKAIDAVRSTTSIKSSIRRNQYELEYSSVVIITQLAGFITEYTNKVLSSKPGIYRKQINGFRSNFTGRAVITSITGVHHYKELHMPYLLSVKMMEPMLMSLMIADGLTPAMTSCYLTNPRMYHDKVRPYLDIYMDLHRAGVVPTIMGRNPTLKHGSIQCLQLTKIKDDIDDPTISVPIYCVRQYNADFDGDEQYVRISLDQREEGHFLRLDPDNTIISLKKPVSLDGTADLHIQSLATVANYIHLTDQEASKHAST